MWLSIASVTVVLAYASWFDWRQRRIPNRLIIYGALVALGLSCAGLGQRPQLCLVWALAVGTPLGLLSLAVPEGWGMGDSKLAAVIALYLGPVAAPALVLGCVAGLAFMVWRRDRVAEGIPFAPFMSAGALAAVAIG